MVGSSVESQTAALIASDWIFGRESDSGSEVVGSLEERTTATWVRGVVDSLEESRQQFLSTNPTEADTLRPSSILNLICRLSLGVWRTGTVCKAAFIRAEEACDI